MAWPECRATAGRSSSSTDATCSTRPAWVPTTYESILAAAEALNSGDQAGIVLATGNDPVFVQQTFEYFAVANDCDVVDADGNVTISSPQCVEVFDFYTNLATTAP